MARSKKKLAGAGAVVASSLVLAACSSSSNVAAPAPTSTASTAVRQEDQFGLAFANDFRSAANGEPAVVNDGDLIPVTLLSEPISIAC